MVLPLAVACTFALASDCSTSSCAQSEDETNLMQVYQNLNKGRERVAKAQDPNVEAEAVEDAHRVGPPGAVNDAFENNLRRARDPIPEEARDRMDFANNVEQERGEIANRAHAFGKMEKQRYGDALTNDQNDVEAVAENRKSVEENAQNAVNGARADFDASELKKRQVDKAAAYGRAEGVREGDAAASRAIADQNIREADRHAAAVRQGDKDAYENHREAVRDAINDGTERQRRDEGAWENKVGDDVYDAERAANAKAHVVENDIEGPDGVKNSFDEHAADDKAKPYGWATRHNEEHINRVAAGGE